MWTCSFISTSIMILLPILADILDPIEYKVTAADKIIAGIQFRRNLEREVHQVHRISSTIYCRYMCLERHSLLHTKNVKQ